MVVRTLLLRNYAVDKKVLSTTNERKVMSKSTFFKRIALTVIAALGFGMLSVAPSNATVTAHTLTIDSATDAITLGDSATAVLSHSFVNLNASDSVTLRAIVTSSNASTAGQIFMSITDSFTNATNNGAEANSPFYGFASTGRAGVNANQALLSTLAFPSSAGSFDSMVIAPSGTSGETYASTALRTNGTTIALKLYNPTAAGTYTVTVYTLTSDSGVAAVSATPSVTWTVTVTEPSRKAEASSTVTLRQGNPAAVTGASSGTAEGTDSQTIAAATGDTTDTSAEFRLFVNQKSLTATTTARESYTVTVTGEAYVAASGSTRPTATTGTKGLTMAHPTPGTASIVDIWSTGTAGSATITVTTVSGLVLGTKTVTFYGDVAKLEVSSAYFQNKIVRAGGFTSPVLFYVKATDAAGNVVPDVNPAIVSSDVSVITSGSCTDVASSGISDGNSACTVSSAIGSVSGGKATLTIRTLDPARAAGTTSYLTATYDVTLGGSVSTEVITLDKTSYSPGEWMVVTVTAKDSSGNPVWDGATAPTLTANKATGGTITMTTYVGGVSTSTAKSSTTGLVTNAQNLGAPAVSGSFVISGLSGNATASPISVTGTVGDDAATAAANAASDAAAEAIDAANAATDAANLAAEAADAATVAAEEARDAADAATAAVEALATEFAALVASVKAQITTLANTVAKIAKKVKA